jgi:hypothetical protein
VRGVETGGLDARRGRLAVDVWGDSSLSGDLVFGTWRGMVAEKDGGGGLTGVTSSSGDVMDSRSCAPVRLGAGGIAILGHEWHSCS